MNPRELTRRRHQLEEQVVQDRLNVVAAVRNWQNATAPIDHGWQQVMRYKGLIALGFSTLAAGTVKRKRSKGMWRWVRRGTLVWTLSRRVRHALSQ